MENMNVIDDKTLSIFVPMKIKKRGGAAMIILPKNIQEEKSYKNYDEKMMQAFAKAYKWKLMIKEGKVKSLSEICKKENVGSSYASRIYRLNLVAPKIVKTVLEGTQPRTLLLQDFMGKAIPDLWQEQLEVYGFKA